MDWKNAVYQCGFAGSQRAYERAYDQLFTALDWLSDRLVDQRYLVGDTITITVTGDAQGGFDDHISGRLVFSNPSVVTPLPPCDSSGCVIFDQPVPGFPSTLFVFTQSVLAASVGTTFVFWEDLDFFGLTNAPGALITVVPEPATAALLGLALAGLAVAERRRRRG